MPDPTNLQEVSSVPEWYPHASREAAREYLRCGYWPIRLESGTKIARFGGWQNHRSSEDTLHKDFPDDCNLGVITGSPHPHSDNWSFTCIDFDFAPTDTTSRDQVLRALPEGVYPTRTGAYQRLQVFCHTDVVFKSAGKNLSEANPAHPFAISAIGRNGKPQLAQVEIRGPNHQSMVPPSRHPGGWPIRWLGPSLTSYTLATLPKLSKFRVQELIAILAEPKAAVHQLGEAAPGSIHNSVIAATAWMVNNQWPDHDVEQRMNEFWARLCQEYSDPGRTERDFHDEWTRAVKQARSKFEHDTHPTRAFKTVEGKGGTTKSQAEGGKAKLARIMADWWKSEHTTEENGPPAVDHMANVRLYKDGWWQPQDKKNIVRDILEIFDVVTARDANEAYATLVSSLNAIPISNPDYICMRSGCVDIRTLTVLPHSPENGMLSCVAFDFDPDAPSPNYDKFMADTFRQRAWEEDPRSPKEMEDDEQVMRDTWEEFSGYALTEYTGLQAMLIVLGPTGSGKSTLADTFSWILPEAVVSAVPLTKMADARNHPAILEARLNISYETGTAYTEAADFINSTAAGDLQSVRKMHSEAVQVRSSVKLIFLGNRIMKTSDTSGAIQRRMVTILAPTKRDNARDRDPSLPAKLRAEAGAIFSRYVIAGNRVLQRGRFLSSAFSDHITGDSQVKADSVRAWFGDRCEFDPRNQLPNDILYFDYSVWAKDRGFKPVNYQEWGSRVSNIDTELRSVQARVPGTQARQMVRHVSWQPGVVPNGGPGGGNY